MKIIVKCINEVYFLSFNKWCVEQKLLIKMIFSLIYKLYIILTSSKKRERGVGKSRRRVRRSGSPPGSVRDSIRQSGKFHTASNHDDTTEGALHWFQDENGK